MVSVTKAGVTISVENNIQIIRFNNPRKRNAIQVRAYSFIKEALENAANNPEIAFTVFTGTDEYYCSGFDISDPNSHSDVEKIIQQDLKVMINAFIDYPKLLVAVVNGPAIGLGVTTLGLCDIVYCSEKATFTTPFTRLGLCAEGCSSYTFPRILGTSKANEMLLVGHEMSAIEAQQFGFVSKVYKHSELSKVWERIAGFKNVSAQSVRMTKAMTRRFDRQQMIDANQMEIDNLKICYQSDDFAQSVVKFLTRKNKL